jgi:hypothetical protein
MTDDEKLARLRQMLDPADTTSDEIANAYLDMAEKAVINLAFPFGDGSEVMPEKYENVQIEIALYMLNKRGAEGETTHTEGGTTRTYESADIPVALRARITPKVGDFGE